MRTRWYLNVLASFSLVFFGVLTGVVYAIQLNLGAGSGSPGSDVTIPITLNYGGATPNISGTSNDIGYNTALLENPRAAIGPAGSAANKGVLSDTPSPGLFRVGVIGWNQNIVQGGIVAYVTFKIKSGAPLGAIALTNTATASDPPGNPVTVGGGAGTITVITVNKWSGPTAFSVKISELADPDKSGNIKFKSVTDSFTGTVQLYYGSESGEIIPDDDGCYIKIESDDHHVTLCFKEIAGIVTQYVKLGATDTFYLKGIGSVKVIDTEVEPPEEFTGIVFLDLTKGTLKRDKIDNHVTSIILSGKIAGGSHGDFVFSATISSTLSKK